MKIKKKQLKGMTLVEVLVALAIFTIACGVLITCCVSANKSVIHTHNLVRSINYQAPTAENMNPSAEKIDETINVNLNLNDTSGATLKQVKIQKYEVQSQTGNDAKGRFKFFVKN